eukprot:430493-Rhodomonas_salina.1
MGLPGGAGTNVGGGRAAGTATTGKEYCMLGLRQYRATLRLVLSGVRRYQEEMYEMLCTNRVLSQMLRE